MAASEPKELWLQPGMGHAESACSQDLVDRIGRWADQLTQRVRAVTAQAAEPGGTGVSPVGSSHGATTPNAAA
jgi:hypothetical protein